MNMVLTSVLNCLMPMLSDMTNHFSGLIQSRRLAPLVASVAFSIFAAGCASDTSSSDDALTCRVAQAPALVCPPPPPTSATEPYLNKLLLADINRIYALQNSALTDEIAQLSGHTDEPSRIKLALVLSRTHQVADSQRALDILKDIFNQASDSNNAWYLWAQLLYPLIEEQHKLNSQLAQQNRSLRDNARQIEDLTQKLNALRAIEESLSTRTAPAGRGQ